MPGDGVFFSRVRACCRWLRRGLQAVAFRVGRPRRAVGLFNRCRCPLAVVRGSSPPGVWLVRFHTPGRPPTHLLLTLLLCLFRASGSYAWAFETALPLSTVPTSCSVRKKTERKNTRTQQRTTQVLDKLLIDRRRTTKLPPQFLGGTKQIEGTRMRSTQPTMVRASPHSPIKSALHLYGAGMQ